jgi:hypothetical protein
MVATMPATGTLGLPMKGFTSVDPVLTCPGLPILLGTTYWHEHPSPPSVTVSNYAGCGPCRVCGQPWEASPDRADLDSLLPGQLDVAALLQQGVQLGLELVADGAGVRRGSTEGQEGQTQTVPSYEATRPDGSAHVDTLAVGGTLPDAPLYLEPGGYVRVPLEATYREAYSGVPFRWWRVLEGGTPPC